MLIYVKLVTGLVVELNVDGNQSIGEIKQHLIERESGRFQRTHSSLQASNLMR